MLTRNEEQDNKMVAEHWDSGMLMGVTGPEAGKGGADVVKDNPMLWGRAGHLTQEQVDCYVSNALLWVPLGFSVLFCCGYQAMHSCWTDVLSIQP